MQTFSRSRLLLLCIPALVLGFLLHQLVEPAISQGIPLAQTELLEPLLLDVTYQSDTALNHLARFDIWEIDREQKTVLISGDQMLQRALINAGFKVRVNKRKSTRLNQPRSASLSPLFNGYQTRAELYSSIDSLAASYPSLVTLHSYGESGCVATGGCLLPSGETISGSNLIAMRLTNHSITGTSTISGTSVVSGTKPVFLFMSALHAREISTPEVNMRFAEWLLSNYGTAGHDATWLLDHHEIWLIPLANPDGYEVVALGESQTGFPYYQRKNLNGTGCSQWPPQAGRQFGVDLNRNHSFSWGGFGSSPFPCDSTYRGTSPASEPEVADLERLIKQLFADQRGPNRTDPAPDDTSGILISMHSYGELVLWPWGDGGTPSTAPNVEGLTTIGEKFGNINGYFAGQATSLYPAAGATDDFSYGELGIPSFTFEVGQSFFPEFDTIESEQWDLNRPALLYAAKIAGAPYMLAKGPDSSGVIGEISGETLTITATISHGQNPNSPVIKAAEATLIHPHWVKDVVTISLQPVDGAFDSSTETVIVETAVPESIAVDQNDVQFTLFVRGQDENDNWGPISAGLASTNVLQPDLTIGYLPLVGCNCKDANR